MKDCFHGVVSLFLIFGAVVVAFVGVSASSPVNALIYGAACVMGAGIMVFSYCSKCACNVKGCGHVLPGKLARLLPARKPGKYCLWDYLGVVFPLGFILVFPQFWLKETPFLWGLFWILVVLAFMEIIIYVCRGCANTNCALQNVRNRFPGCASICSHMGTSDPSNE